MAKRVYKARIPVQQRAVETKKKIMKAARRLFAQKGYYGTNALEIARMAGVATGSFYGYFNNKKEVLIEAIKDFYSESTRRVITVYDIPSKAHAGEYGPEARRIIHHAIRALYSTHDIEPSLHREIVAMVLTDQEIAGINREEERKVVEAITGLLDSFADHLRVGDTKAAAVLLYHTADEIIHRIRYIGEEISEKRLLAELEDMLCRYLLDEE